MADDPERLDRDHERPEPDRWSTPGIYIIGSVVIWDGEAKYLDLPPLTRWPPHG
jgi:hypothetical protein